jgi:hypothetical protein
MRTAAKIALYFTQIWCVVIKYRFAYRKKTPNWTCSGSTFISLAFLSPIFKASLFHNKKHLWFTMNQGAGDDASRQPVLIKAKHLT